MEKIINSVKIKFNKLIGIVWGVIAVTLIALIVITVADFSKYKEIQEFAVNSTLAVTDEFNNIQGDYDNLVEKMYDYYNLSKISGSYGGYYYDNSEVVEAREDADWALGNLIENTFNIDCFKGSYYFADTNYIEYTARCYYIEFGIWVIPFALWLIVSMLYFIDKKHSLTVTDEKIICKNCKKVVKEFFVKDIKIVQSTKLHGLKIKGNGIKYNINLLKNADEIRMYLMDCMEKANKSNMNGQTIQLCNLGDLKQIKELLDMGAITQEEFDEKKKQLLNL